MGPVLVGLDGSRESLCALRWAAWFAATTQRELHVAHAWQHGRALEPALTPAAGRGHDSLEDGIRESLRVLVTHELDDPSLVTEYLALRGEIVESLAMEARNADGTLIVVGARGSGGALRALLGSVSRELTQCPGQTVAVIPDEAVLPEREGWSIVVGVDGSTGSSRALRWTAVSAQRGGARVVAVHAVEPPVPDLSPGEQASVDDEMRHRLDEEWCAPLRHVDVAYVPVIERGRATAVLMQTADDVQPACVVVGSRGLGALSQRLLGSVTHTLVREMRWPTVVVPAPRDCVIWKI